MRNGLGSLSFVALAVGIAAFGCDGAMSEGSGSTPGGRTDFVREFAAAFCEGIANCCTQNAIPHDLVACRNALEAQLNQTLSDEFANPAIGFDSNAAGRCIAAYRDAVIACTDQALANNVDAPCEQMLVGTVAIGGACTDDEECVANADQDVECTRGICTEYTSLVPPADLPRASLGAVCAGTCEQSDDGSSSCNQAMGISITTAACYVSDGLVCSNGTCTALPTVGQSCGNSFVCASGAFCDVETCVSKKANGAACLSSSECVGGQCGSDGLCRTWTVASAESCGGALGG